LIVSKNGIVRPNFRVKDKALLKSLLSFSIWVTVLAFAERMIFNIAPSILGITSDSMEIARFAPASQLEGYFFTFAFAINGLFLPTVARYDYQEQTDKFEQLMIKVGRYQILVLGMLFTGIVVLAPDFTTLWMGAEYRVSGYCTILLILPTLLQYPEQIANTLLSVRNKIKYQAMVALTIGCINIGLSFLLTPYYGVWGSAISIMIAYFVSFTLLNIVYRKQLGLKLGKFYKKIYLKHLPLIAVSIVVSILACHFVPIGGWIGFAIKVAICIVIYLVVICTLGVSKQEKKQVVGAIRKKLTRTK
jgi:O-antigen/teichoic acid export membrane protein